MEDRRLVWQRRLGPVLEPAAWLYGVFQRGRRFAYGRGLLTSVRVDRPVISVGSLLAGGTGKSPVVAHLAQRLAPARTAILSRGYGGSYTGSRQVTEDCAPSVCGDEPVLLARTTPADVWVARRRAPLASQLAARYDVLVLDDGYQHLALERFLNICVLPKESPGRLLPAGLWREGPAALAAADLVIALDDWPVWVEKHYDGPRVVIKLRRGVWQSGLETRTPDVPVFAFCGVARPERFLGSLSDLDVRGQARFPDHHAYSPTELAALVAKAKRLGALALVTTAKDAVRVPAAELPIYWCDVEVHFAAGESELDAMLKGVLHLA